MYGTIARFKLKKECLRDFMGLGRETHRHRPHGVRLSMRAGGRKRGIPRRPGGLAP